MARAGANFGNSLERLVQQASHHLAGNVARFNNGVFWVPVDEPMPTGKRQLIEGVER